jgi:hypothetical protein
MLRLRPAGYAQHERTSNPARPEPFGKLREIVSNGVERVLGGSLLLGDDYMFFFSLCLHSLFQLSSFKNAFASCKSLVSKPSVNQL